MLKSLAMIDKFERYTEIDKVRIEFRKDCFGCCFAREGAGWKQLGWLGGYCHSASRR